MPCSFSVGEDARGRGSARSRQDVPFWRARCPAPWCAGRGDDFRGEQEVDGIGVVHLQAQGTGQGTGQGEGLHVPQALHRLSSV